jgi:hypothetical protein
VDVHNKSESTGHLRIDGNFKVGRHIFDRGEEKTNSYGFVA